VSQVFVSYKREEKSISFVKHLKESLEAADFDVWIDQELLRPGQDWKKEIDNAIKASIALIVVLTPEAHKSNYVTYEWAFSIGRGMEVIPLLLEATDLHPRLNDIQFINFTNHFSLPWDHLIDRLREIETGSLGKTQRIPPYVERAVDMLDSYEPHERETAINRLTQSNHPSAIEALALAVNHHIEDVRFKSALKLAEVSNYRDIRALPGLLEAMTDNTLYAQVSIALQNYGTHAVSGVIQLLDHPWSEVRRRAAKTLGKLQDIQAVPKLLNILRNDPEVRPQALETLHEIGDPTAISGFIDVLQDESVGIRSRAAIVLGVYKNEIAIPSLLGSLRDSDEQVRLNAAHSLVQIGLASLPGLMAALHDKSVDVMTTSAKALGIMEAKEAVEELVKLTKHKNGDLRLVVIRSLGQIGEPLAVPNLIELMDDTNYHIREIAAWALGQIRDKSATTKLCAALEDQSWEVRLAVVKALGIIGEPEAAVPLLNYLSKLGYEDRYSLIATIEALGNIRNPIAVNPLTSYMADTRKMLFPTDEGLYSVPVDQVTAKALRNIGTPDALEAIEQWRQEQGEQET
jgi:HEAT repeat protein